LFSNLFHSAYSESVNSLVGRRVKSPDDLIC